MNRDNAHVVYFYSVILLVAFLALANVVSYRHGKEAGRRISASPVN